MHYWADIKPLQILDNGIQSSNFRINVCGAFYKKYYIIISNKYNNYNILLLRILKSVENMPKQKVRGQN